MTKRASSCHTAGLSWYRPVKVQLLAAHGGVAGAEVPAWSALVVDGAVVPYEEVAGVWMDENALEFRVTHAPPGPRKAAHGDGDAQADVPVQHLRMFTRSEFNLWRVALYPKITNPSATITVTPEGASAGGAPTAIYAARKWLANAEQAL